MKNENKTRSLRLMLVLVLQTSTMAVAAETDFCRLFDGCHDHERTWSAIQLGAEPRYAQVRLPKNEETDFINKFILEQGDTARISLFKTYADKWARDGWQMEYRTLKAILIGLDSEQARLSSLSTTLDHGIFWIQMGQNSLLNLLSFFEIEQNKFEALKVSLAASAVRVQSLDLDKILHNFKDQKLRAALKNELNQKENK